MKTTTTAVLLRKGEIAATIRHSVTRRRFGPPSGAYCAHRPIVATAPVFISPIERASIAATVTVAVWESPEIACAGSRIPPSSSRTGTARATWSIEKRSRTNMTSATATTANTKAISQVSGGIAPVTTATGGG